MCGSTSTRGLNEQEIPASHDEQLLQQWRYLSTLMSCRCDRRASCDEFKHRPVQLSVVWTCGPKLNPQTIWVTSSAVSELRPDKSLTYHHFLIDPQLIRWWIMAGQSTELLGRPIFLDFHHLFSFLMITICQIPCIYPTCCLEHSNMTLELPSLSTNTHVRGKLLKLIWSINVHSVIL